MSDKRGLDELIIIMCQPCNALVITLQLGVNCRSFVPPLYCARLTPSI